METLPVGTLLVMISNDWHDDYDTRAPFLEVGDPIVIIDVTKAVGHRNWIEYTVLSRWGVTKRSDRAVTTMARVVG